MAQVRLRVNMIIENKFHSRGSIIDDGLIPEHLRNATHVEDLENRQGKVLLLRDLSFQSLPRASSSGIPTQFPVHVSAGELLDLTQVPASQRERLREGEDFRANWTHEELSQMQRIGVTSIVIRLSLNPLSRKELLGSYEPLSISNHDRASQWPRTA